MLVHFAGRFTKIPANITAKEGQNIEMECAFQSETASVYLEIQWWFIRAPEEPSESEEEEEEMATEVVYCFKDNNVHNSFAAFTGYHTFCWVFHIESEKCALV